MCARVIQELRAQHKHEQHSRPRKHTYIQYASLLSCTQESLLFFLCLRLCLRLMVILACMCARLSACLSSFSFSFCLSVLHTSLIERHCLELVHHPGNLPHPEPLPAVLVLRQRVCVQELQQHTCKRTAGSTLRRTVWRKWRNPGR